MPTSIEFPEVNVILAKDQPQYNPLPAHRVPDDPTGRVITAWLFSDNEMQRMHEGARVFKEGGGLLWHQVLTFNNPYPPMALVPEKPFVAPPVVAEPEKVISPPYSAAEYELALQQAELTFAKNRDRMSVLKSVRRSLETLRNPRP